MSEAQAQCKTNTVGLVCNARVRQVPPAYGHSVANGNKQLG